MGRDIAISTAHGTVCGWRADPPHGAPLGGLVVIQEIFGVNQHMRTVVERYAAEGYVTLAPALYDPVERHVELDYGEEGFAHGRELAAALGFDRAVQLVSAAAALLRGEGHKTAAIGFCWGGSVAFLANTRLGLPAVSYYGARTVPFLGEPLRAPMLLHFGADDASIPAGDIEAHRQRLPEAQIHVYEGAGHAFNRDVDPRHYHAASAALAHRRTLQFLEEALA
ncbi:dienelactone hydrolase family protein [Luteimonas sp. RD2P54]|uniref:Dienelactone hydrolase family protein n=1 Tax=Luteimonas endophytica TaxID=3042023 RepID=A0ABT6JBT0_9GAMM|nr:dienelactone hydrolase family protein [Luteimonas endophytica]MDH5824275.1 dienelactone hydrolase family protein [Luteimonas endophytica]